MEADVQDFLEHVGVKGMRWGYLKSVQRSERAHTVAKNRPTKRNLEKAQEKQRKTNWKDRPRNTNAERGVIAVTTLGAGFLAARFVGGKTGSPALTIVSGGAAALVGKKFASSMMAKRPKKTISELSNGN